MTKKFKNVAQSLSDFEVQNEQSVVEEDKLIKKLRAEFLLFLSDQSTILEFLNSETEGLKYWTAACCLENKVLVEEAMEVMRSITTVSNNINLTKRSSLIVLMWDNDRDFLLDSI